MQIIVFIALLMVGCGPQFGGPEAAQPCEFGGVLTGWALGSASGRFELTSDSCGHANAAGILSTEAGAEVYISRQVQGVRGPLGLSASFASLLGSGRFGVSIGGQAADISRSEGAHSATVASGDAADLRLWLYADPGEATQVTVQDVRFSQGGQQ